jgi:hypothetical protein
MARAAERMKRLFRNTGETERDEVLLGLYRCVDEETRVGGTYEWKARSYDPAVALNPICQSD